MNLILKDIRNLRKLLFLISKLQLPQPRLAPPQEPDEGRDREGSGLRREARQRERVLAVEEGDVLDDLADECSEGDRLRVGGSLHALREPDRERPRFAHCPHN